MRIITITEIVMSTNCCNISLQNANWPSLADYRNWVARSIQQHFSKLSVFLCFSCPFCLLCFNVFGVIFFVQIEIAKVQQSGRIPQREQKYVDIYREKQIRVTVKVLVPVKEHPKVSVHIWITYESLQIIYKQKIIALNWFVYLFIISTWFFSSFLWFSSLFDAFIFPPFWKHATRHHIRLQKKTETSSISLVSYLVQKVIQWKDCKRRQCVKWLYWVEDQWRIAKRYVPSGCVVIWVCWQLTVDFIKFILEWNFSSRLLSCSLKLSMKNNDSSVFCAKKELI